MTLLKDCRAIVTGGGHPSGIGQATARLFVEQGAEVVVFDRAFPISELPAGQTARVLDVGDAVACGLAVDEAARTLGGIDIVVNNAGIVAPTRIPDMTAEDFARMLAVNVVGTFNVTRAALPHLKQSRRNPAIVNLGSIAAQRGGGLLGGSHYAASKGGVISFTKATARECGPLGIRANAVAPGIIDTGMTEGKYDGNRRRAISETIPLGRFGTAEDVARVILFLASPLAGYLTGTVIDVNGGYHIH
ncbi:MAG: SDR family oxidoreductase [Phreatobacter sp.]|uniref:SDR family NAD(P)-dependent oxidoreductase n=1 Tax=Phreatobacter sp. TaxID=1966341 RepID=UPI001A44D8D1|nr:SDR family NAD(P)-dependent oxidoreductase [Phreatobacter sp.]MBL8570259.1 SDR family oxidoreductase [Phreatobacter sp.]